MKKILTVLIIFLSILFISGCDTYTKYLGEDYALFTEAMNSILFTNGRSFKESRGPELIRIEEDDYGRVLYFYYEHGMGYYYLISQYYDDKYVYYYEDYNFIISKSSVFHDGSIEYLKEINDWNNKLDLTKCVKKEIISEKKLYNLDNKKIEDIFKELYYSEFSTIFSVELTSNDHDKVIVCVNGNDSSYGQLFVLIIDKDYSYTDDCILKIDDDYLYDYQEILRDFKERNAWY